LQNSSLSFGSSMSRKMPVPTKGIHKFNRGDRRKKNGHCERTDGTSPPVPMCHQYSQGLKHTLFNSEGRSICGRNDSRRRAGLGWQKTSDVRWQHIEPSCRTRFFGNDCTERRSTQTRDRPCGLKIDTSILCYSGRPLRFPSIIRSSPPQP
jgi:hypothetical protein